MVLSATLPGWRVPLHSHPNEQIGMVYSGEGRLLIGKEERVARRGDFYRIPAGVPHGDSCLGGEPFIMLDVFCPPRVDFLRSLATPTVHVPNRPKRMRRPVRVSRLSSLSLAASDLSRVA